MINEENRVMDETQGWKPTHESINDGSTVRVVQLEPFTIENEDGDRWVDDPGMWSPIESTEPRKRMCFYIIESQYVQGKGYVPSVVTEGEAGHSPLTGQGEFSEPWYWGHDYAKACEIAAEQNRKLGLTDEDVKAIVDSSLDGGVVPPGRSSRRHGPEARAMKPVRISYVVRVDDNIRRQINAYYGRPGLATRAQVQAWYEAFGHSMDDDLSNQEVG